MSQLQQWRHGNSMLVEIFSQVAPLYEHKVRKQIVISLQSTFKRPKIWPHVKNVRSIITNCMYSKLLKIPLD